MATIAHSALTTTDLHEPKGVAAATEGRFYMSDGAGSGNWQYLPMGWGYYKDNATAQTFNTTEALLSIDGAGSTTDEAYLPFAIRGSGSLWNTTTDKVTPIQAGDSYNVRLDLPVTSETGNPTELTVYLDIGGSIFSSAVNIVTRYVGTGKSTPYNISASFPIFCGSTFVANGGQFWLATDTGSLDITAPSIFIDMNSSGAL